MFAEEQGFSGWMKAISILSFVVFAVPAVALWFGPAPVPIALFAAAVAVLLAFLTLPSVALKLVMTVEGGWLRIRLVPEGLPVPFAPARERDVPLTDIESAEARTYNAITDRKYWGRHFWGLASASHGRRSMYVMKAGPARARGVEIRLRSGDDVFLGSQRPGELADAIARAKSDAGRPATST